MNLSMKWLSEFVTLDPMSPREFAEAMTMSGSKVEGWEIEGEKLYKITVPYTHIRGYETQHRI